MSSLIKIMGKMEIKLSTIRISQESVTLLVLLVHEQRANNEKIGEFIDLMINAIAIFFLMSTYMIPDQVSRLEVILFLQVF